jgi:hypothetical protein
MIGDMKIIEQYIASWNETDADGRRALIDEVFAADAAYTDPMAELHGRDEIAAGIAGVQQMFPGLVFSLAGLVDSHHNQARFTWHLGPADGGEPVVIGFDVAVLDPAGQITNVLGFLDKVPAA